jgi:hypothetical protein
MSTYNQREVISRITDVNGGRESGLGGEALSVDAGLFILPTAGTESFGSVPPPPGPATG